jgi:peroxiredoxin
MLATGVPWLLVAIGGWLVFELIRLNGRVLLRLDSMEERLAALAAQTVPGDAPQVRKQVAETRKSPTPELALGSPALAFELPDLAGNRHALTEYRGRQLLLIFFNPHCGFCTRMCEALADLSPEGTADRPVPLLISTGSVEDNRALLEEYGVRSQLLLQRDMEVALRYGCEGTPMGYLIDEQGVIASARTVGAEALLALAQPRAIPAAKGPELPAEAQPYDLVDLAELQAADAMVEELCRHAGQSRRLIVVLGRTERSAMRPAEATALRRFLRQQPRWLVAYQASSPGRFLVLSSDPHDRKPLPPILTKATNFARAMATHIADGAKKVTAEELERRWELCILCDQRNGDFCAACGCDLTIKAGWRTSKCPLGKWPAGQASNAARIPALTAAIAPAHAAGSNGKHEEVQS